MDNLKAIDQVINLLGQIHICGWDDIQRLVSANVLLTNLKDTEEKQKIITAESAIKERE